MPSAYAYHRQVENAWLVRDRDRGRRRELALVVLLALPVVLALLAFVWLHVMVLDTAYHIDELEGELRELERLRDALAVEEASQRGLPAIERRAAAELGMTTPTARRTVPWQELAP